MNAKIGVLTKKNKLVVEKIIVLIGFL